MRKPLKKIFLSLVFCLALSSFSSGFEKEASDKTLGPFPLSGKSFSIKVQVERIRSGDDPAFSEEAVRQFEIRDEKKVVHFKKEYSYQILPDGFSESVSIRANLLEGEKGNGLIIHYDVLPSAPSSGHFCQIFAVKEGGLKPLSLPLGVYGRISPLPQGTSQEALKLFPGDRMEFRLWTGNYDIIVPVRINFDEMKIETPISGIFEIGTGNTPEELKKPAPGAKVNLFSERDLKAAPRQVTLREDSKVEFIAASSGIFVEEYEGALYISEEDPWLNVRIDGEEGWVKYEEDLSALGLPRAG